MDKHYKPEPLIIDSTNTAAKTMSIQQHWDVLVHCKQSQWKQNGDRRSPDTTITTPYTASENQTTISSKIHKLSRWLIEQPPLRIWTNILWSIQLQKRIWKRAGREIHRERGKSPKLLLKGHRRPRQPYLRHVPHAYARSTTPQ